MNELVETQATNCWLNAYGEPHPCPIKEHGKAARRIAQLEGASPADGSTEAVFRALYELGYARIQWERPGRVNVAFHHLTTHTREKLQDFIDILIHSQYTVGVFSKAGHEYITLADRYWKQRLESLNRDPDAGQEDRFTGGGTSKTPLVG